MFNKTAPMYLVENVDEALSWYTSTLGASLQHRLPDRPPYEWVSLKLGDAELMFAQKKAAQEWYSNNVAIGEKPTNLITYIYMEDLLEFYDRIKGKVKVILKPIDQFYGIREFAIQDPFGFCLIFAQELGVPESHKLT